MFLNVCREGEELLNLKHCVVSVFVCLVEMTVGEFSVHLQWCPMFEIVQWCFDVNLIGHECGTINLIVHRHHFHDRQRYASQVQAQDAR